MRESKIESKLVAAVKAVGGMCLKFTSPGRRNVPDRLMLRPIPPEHRALVAQYFRFVETKATGGKPRPRQLAEHERLRDLGFTVDVLNDEKKVSCLVNNEVSNE